jgi:hypothetical protein
MTALTMLRHLVLAALSPLLEKNALKTFALRLPVVFSMSRLIVLAFAVAELRLLWRGAVGGWPEATLAITIVLALPILGALQRVEPAQVLDVARALLGRFGVGDVTRSPRSPRSPLSLEPSKFDDHRADV